MAPLPGYKAPPETTRKCLSLPLNFQPHSNICHWLNLTGSQLARESGDTQSNLPPSSAREEYRRVSTKLREWCLATTWHSSLLAMRFHAHWSFSISPSTQQPSPYRVSTQRKAVNFHKFEYTLIYFPTQSNKCLDNITSLSNLAISPLSYTIT